MNMVGVSHPDSVTAGVVFSILVARNPDFLDYLGKIGATEPCPIACVFDGMDEKNHQILIDSAFMLEASIADHILIVSVDQTQPYGLRIVRHAFTDEVNVLEQELRCILSNGS